MAGFEIPLLCPPQLRATWACPAHPRASHQAARRPVSPCTPLSLLPSHAGDEGSEGPGVWPSLEPVAALTRAQAQARGISNIHLEISTKGLSACLHLLAIPAFLLHRVLGWGIGNTWLQRLHRLSVESGQLWNSTTRGGRCDARAQISTVHEICSDARQIWQVGWHIDLRDLSQIWHIEVVFSYLKETQNKKIRQ